MTLELPLDELKGLVARQLTTLFVLRNDESEHLESGVERALERCELCFSFNPNKYFRKDGQVWFSPFHSGQYTIFLYYLSRALFNQMGRHSLPDRIYYLNKALNGCDLYYEVEMPDVFSLDHPVGSVMGRATYANYFSFSQNCTVGNNKGLFPRFDEHVSMLSGSKVVGNCKIGRNVVFSANAYVKDTDVPSDTLVFGASPNLIFKPNRIPVAWLDAKV